MDVADIFVGASNFKALGEHLNTKNSYTIAVPGLTYQNNHKMQILEDMLKSTLNRFKPKKVRFFVSCLLNSYFPGKPNKRHYLPLVKNNKKVIPLTPPQMAQKHVNFLKRLKGFVNGEIQIFTIPFASRKRNKCMSNCQVCISYKNGVRKLWLLEKSLTKEFENTEFILISMQTWWEYFISKSGNLSRKDTEKLLRAKTSNKKYANPQQCLQGEILSASIICCRYCRAQNRRDLDHIHFCCQNSKGQYASFINYLRNSY